ncbi:RHS repeat protein [Fodinicola feengrottensis]|uniref:RHS repeat protein n=1 Tax=Fodinicola feengrottensis TaxID=435914 RepID=UPI0013D729D0|nr:RHS repeat protein [Fodinicola feengrottensis]
MRNADGGLSPIKGVTITDPGGATLTHRYDVNNGMREISDNDATGALTSYGYDTGGFVHAIGDGYGRTTVVGHDVRGNEVSQTTCQNQHTQVCSTSYKTYLPDDTSTSLTPSPKKRCAGQHQRRPIASATDPAYRSTYGYDAAGNQTAVTTPAVAGYPNGRTTTIAYTDGTTVKAAATGFAPVGLPYKTVSPSGATTTVSYFHNGGDIASVTDPAGAVTSYTYDGVGQTLTQKENSDTFPNGLITSYTYNKAGQVTSEADPGVTNRITGAVHTANISTSYAPDGQLLSQTTADVTGGDAPRTTSVTYDDHGLAATSTDPLGKITSYSYDGYGRRTSETDPSGQTTAYTYDAEGRPLDQILKDYTGDPNSPSPKKDLVISHRVYDVTGKLTYLQDSNGNWTYYVYYDNGLLNAVGRIDQADTTVFWQQVNGYDADGNLTEQDSNNQASWFQNTVDAGDRVTASTVAGVNRTTTIAYDGDDHPTSSIISDGTGATNTTAATYDPLGHVTSKTVSDNAGRSSKTSWTLDKRGLPTSMTNPANAVTTYAYDEDGQLAVTTGPAVNAETSGAAAQSVHPITTIGYDTASAPTETEDPNGNVTTTAYDAAGQKTSVTQPAYIPPGASSPTIPVTRWAYDDTGDTTSVTDPLGNTVAYTYDQLNDTASVTDPRGGITRNSYDPAGHLLQSATPNGATTQATYDWMGRPLTSTVLERYPAAASYTTTNSYAASQANPAGAYLTSTTTPAGATTSYGYDAAGEQTSVTDPAGTTTVSAYNLQGHVAKTTLADGTATATTYDHLGDPLTATQLDTDGTTVLAKTSATYDPAGRQLTSTDARNHTSTLTRDASGLVTQEQQPVDDSTSITTTFGYDAAGHRTRFTDGRANSWITTFNSWNLPESSIEPGTATYTAAADRTTTTTYDADGHPAGTTKPGGVTFADTYDKAGELLSQSGSGADAPTADRSFSYDPDGRITKASTAAAGDTGPTGPQIPATDESFTYNDRGQLLTASGSAASSSFGYTADGLLASRTDAAGTATYAYDTADRLATATDPITSTQISVGYNQLSMPTTLTYGTNGNARTYGYDHQHRLTSDTLKTSGGTTVASIGYGYDANDNLTSKTTTGLGAGSAANTYTYDYDYADRLTSWNDGTKTVPYGYDASGNRTRVGANVYTYDARDELTSDGTNSYTYTAPAAP